MKKKILFNILIYSAIFSAHADDISMQMQQMNAASVQSEDTVWQRMRDGFALNHDETKEVKYWEKRYGSPKYFNIIMQNASPYLYFVVTEMQRRGVPTELALIPIVESTYNPNAVSPAAISTGMWQFISSSGSRFGLIQNSDLDERKDIVKSTRAAVNYFIYLHDMFGTWELAIAAYNWGEGNINNAVKSANSNNFYDLSVRDVTRQYVPKVIALANIIQNPSKFGIKLTNLKNQPYFAIINPLNSLSINQFMTMSNLSANDNKKLNPQYNSTSYMVSPTQRLLLPVVDQPIYLASLGAAGQNLAPAITTPPPTQIADNLQPVPSESTPAVAIGGSDGIAFLAAQGDNGATNITIQNKSQPLAKVAINGQGTTSTQINTGAISDLLGGAVIATAPSTRSSSNKINYTVSQGDTLYSIAKKFSVPIATIVQDNQLTDNTVKLNQTLIIRSMNGTNS